MKDNKYFFIIIDGQDRVGKTTLCKKLFDETGKVHNFIDRGPMSNYVYSKMYNRGFNTDLYVDFLLNNDIIIVYLTACVDEIKSRTVNTNDFNVGIDEIEKHKYLWDEAFEYFKKCGVNVFKIDNSSLNIDETMRVIKKKIIGDEE